MSKANRRMSVGVKILWKISVSSFTMFRETFHKEYFQKFYRKTIIKYVWREIFGRNYLFLLAYKKHVFHCLVFRKEFILKLTPLFNEVKSNLRHECNLNPVFKCCNCSKGNKHSTSLPFLHEYFPNCLLMGLRENNCTRSQKPSMSPLLQSFSGGRTASIVSLQKFCSSRWAVHRTRFTIWIELHIMQQTAAIKS